MTPPASFFGETLIDYSNEKSSWRVALVDLTAGNVAAQQMLITALASAVDAISLMNIISNTTTFSENKTAASIPTNPLAQRENKWLVRYHDTVTNLKYQVEIPGADLSLLSTTPQSDYMDPGSAEYLAFKAAFDAVVKSPANSSNGVAVDSLQFVGRKL
jgi:hypothetical protein